MNRRSLFSGLSKCVAFLLILISIGPYFLVALNSFGTSEGFTFRAYYYVFFGRSQYLIRFWASIILALAVTCGQLVVSVLAGFSFAKWHFPGRDGIFFALILLMMLPIQVTLVPNYIMLNQLGLLNTIHALIVPGIFLPLGTIILRQNFLAIPDSILEAAMLDGCGVLRQITRIAVPISRSGVICVMILSFLDAWNMVEQPIAYLQSFSQYPLSVALAYSPEGNESIQMVCCMLAAIPCLFLFSIFNRDFTEGIVLAEMK